MDKEYGKDGKDSKNEDEDWVYIGPFSTAKEKEHKRYESLLRRNYITEKGKLVRNLRLTPNGIREL